MKRSQEHWFFPFHAIFVVTSFLCLPVPISFAQSSDFDGDGIADEVRFHCDHGVCAMKVQSSKDGTVFELSSQPTRSGETPQSNNNPSNRVRVDRKTGAMEFNLGNGNVFTYIQKHYDKFAVAPPIQAQTASPTLPSIPANDINGFLGYFCGSGQISANIQIPSFQIPNFEVLNQIIGNIQNTVAQVQGLTQLLQVLEDPSASLTVNGPGDIANCLPGFSIPNFNFEIPDIASCIPNFSGILDGVGACIQSKIPKLPKVEIPNFDPKKFQNCVTNLIPSVNFNANIPGIDITNPLSIITGLLSTIQGITNLIQNFKVVFPDFSQIQFSLDFLKNYCANFTPSLGTSKLTGGIPAFVKSSKGKHKGKYLVKLDSNTIGICTKNKNSSFTCKRPDPLRAR